MAKVVSFSNLDEVHIISQEEKKKKRKKEISE